MPHVQPSTAELQDMSQKALQVVRLLEDFKRAHLPDSERNKLGDPSEDHRAPKRPWEDMAQEGAANGDQSGEVRRSYCVRAMTSELTGFS